MKYRDYCGVSITTGRDTIHREQYSNPGGIDHVPEIHARKRASRRWRRGILSRRLRDDVRHALDRRERILADFVGVQGRHDAREEECRQQSEESELHRRERLAAALLVESAGGN